MLKQYAAYFVAFLLDHLKDTKIIQRIILYGSVAKDEATPESDVDLFFDVKKKTKQLERNIKNVENQFYHSRECALFKVRGIDNKFSIKIGILREWEDLQSSIASTGILLYGPYETRDVPSGMKHYLIIFWNAVEKNRGSFLNKLYGYTIHKKRYAGLLQRIEGKKLGKSCIMIPVGYKGDVFHLLRDHKAHAKILEVFC